MTLAVCLVTASAQPIFFPGLAAGTTIALGANGLVTTVAGVGAVNTVPLAGVALAGGAVGAAGIGKLLLIKSLLDARN